MHDHIHSYVGMDTGCLHEKAVGTPPRLRSHMACTRGCAQQQQPPPPFYMGSLSQPLTQWTPFLPCHCLGCLERPWGAVLLLSVSWIPLTRPTRTPRLTSSVARMKKFGLTVSQGRAFYRHRYCFPGLRMNPFI